MAPAKISARKPIKKSFLQDISSKYLTVDFVKSLVFDPARLQWISLPILFAELVLNVFIVSRVNYTEIDWVAYMQQVDTFLNGTLDYSQLKGEEKFLPENSFMLLKFFIREHSFLFIGSTGPLVYPAAHVYIYTFFYFITSRGKNIRFAQFIFIALYLLTLWLVLRLYSKSRRIPPYVVVLSVFTSYRIHSIYSLRLFNDPIAMLLLYAALNLFMDRKWHIGSFMFSVAVGVKMNILLFSPAILMLYIINLGYLQTIIQLAICGITQILIGLPFLLTYPFAYIKGSFDFGRVFEHKWTVNYRFLPREIFESKPFHLSLLIIHVLLLFTVLKPCIIFFKNYARLRILQKQFQPQIAAENREIEELVRQKMKRPKPKVPEQDDELSEEQQKFIKSFEKGMKDKFRNTKSEPEPAVEEDPKKIKIHFDQCVQLALLPIFLTNFIGVICARSLHYQFYVWYFHSLPYLSWFTDYHSSFKILLLFLIEFCWNQYPSTIFSSVLLHFCHITLLVGVIRKLYRETRLAREASAAAKNN